MKLIDSAGQTRRTEPPLSGRHGERVTGRSSSRDNRAFGVGLYRGLTAATAAATVAVIVASCGSAPGDTEPASPSDSGAGAELYQSNCASCHGVDLRGTDEGPSHLSVVYEPSHHGDESFRSAILNGVPEHHWNFGDMAAIPGLDRAEIDAIIGYVRAEQERQGFER